MNRWRTFSAASALSMAALAGGLAGAGCTTRIGAVPVVPVTDGGVHKDGGRGASPDASGDAVGWDAGDAGTGATVACSFQLSAAISTIVPTVGIVTFATSLPAPGRARIDFGLDTTYGMTAPVDLRQPSYRTLLLGMKAGRTYHFRVVATNASGSCASADAVLATGPLPAGLLPALTVTTINRAALLGGFLITTQLGSNGASGSTAIIDADGDYVWWTTDGLGASAGARMTSDGTALWINSANAPGQTARVRRVTMDGATQADFSTAFAGAHDQLAPLPDGRVAFCASNPATGCDDLKLFPADGTTNSNADVIAGVNAADAGGGACACSGLAYSTQDGTLVYADTTADCITKVTLTGRTLWVLNGGRNGTLNSFSGAAWMGGVHGLQALSANDLLLFANNSAAAGGTGAGSAALEIQLDIAGARATTIWSYTSRSGIQVDGVGDVQRLPNGNTVVAYSTRGELQEVDAAGTLLQDIRWPSGSSFGYIEKRQSLYGTPIR